MDPAAKRRVAEVTIVVTAALLAVIGTEAVLAALDHPAGRPPPVVHPPNVREARRSLEFAVEFRTNRFGLRDREIDASPAPGVRRRLVVGDSFVEGWGVDEEARFSNLLEARWRAAGRSVEVVNAGRTGAGPIELGRIALELGRALAPDEILLCLYANEVANTPRDARPARLDGPADAPGGLRGAALRVFPRVTRALGRSLAARRERGSRGGVRFLESVAAEARRRGLSGESIRAWEERIPGSLAAAVDRGEFNGRILSNGLLYPEYWTDSIDVTSPRARAQWEAMTAILDETVRRCRSAGVAVRFAFLPAPVLHDARFHAVVSPGVVAGTGTRRAWLTETTEIQRRLAAWATEADVPFLDLTPAFRAATGAGRVTNFALDGHWNESGHALAADAIAAWWDGGTPR